MDQPINRLEQMGGGSDRIAYTVLRPAPGTAEEFVAFWECLYSGFDEEFYEQNIGQPLTEERIIKWFQWKNGMPLSPLKAESIRPYSSSDERIAADADDATLREFLLRPGGVIWRVFWLHLQHPEKFPIYDRHVHRAMAFLLGWPNREISAGNPTKARLYLDKYRPFFRRFATMPRRRVDRALWAFSKFLASDYGAMVASPSSS